MSRVAITAGQVRALAQWSAERILEFLAKLTMTEMVTFDAQFEAWAQPGQRPPPGEGWSTWLMMAGRGYGKTRAGAEWVHRLAMQRKVRIALVGATIDEARKIMVEGVSGVLAVADLEGARVKWEPSLGRLTWRNGSVATLFSGENGDGLRGPEHDFAWCDEMAKWSDAENAWDNLQMGLRRGERPRALVTTTPRPIPLLRRLMKQERTVVTGGRSGDNVNLPARFMEVMKATYGGTRFGRQEIDGELLEDARGSLWPRARIEACRIDRSPLPMMERVVVGVDPPAGSGPGNDACGIVVAGRAGGNFYVLADASVEAASPEQWARAVALAASAWGADRIVAEANNGGDMVKSVLRASGVEGAAVRLVHASRGKVARAEPVALRFEAGTAWFAGGFCELEDELAGLCSGGAYEGPGRSPDRADAMVWAMTELAESRSGVPRVMRL
ncbi:terminase large subunit domain-containing protein [Sphingomonas sp.]|uniref:DNA-packaging protein n=1 Tax=Sphingomonas sp. TaxID=28214 RepID=UPI00286C3FE8|nr:terminase family protein [Sphingomonas sp.]